MKPTDQFWRTPEWSVPEWVGCLYTDRGRHEPDPASGANLALHVQDNTDDVQDRRQMLADGAGCPKIHWLSQSHSTRVVNLSESQAVDADASYTRASHHSLAVMTADCLPVLVCSRTQKEVAAIHAGWRGLHQGIILETLSLFSSSANELCAWIGPAIGPSAFEVGPEVVAAFRQWPMQVDDLIHAAVGEKSFIDLPGLAQRQMELAGITSVTQSKLCTYSDSQLYSHRRHPSSGRQASLIWIKS